MKRIIRHSLSGRGRTFIACTLLVVFCTSAWAYCFLKEGGTPACVTAGDTYLWYHTPAPGFCDQSVYWDGTVFPEVCGDGYSQGWIDCSVYTHTYTVARHQEFWEYGGLLLGCVDHGPLSYPSGTINCDKTTKSGDCNPS